MILVGQYGSPFVRRVAVTLTHYGMAFERQVVSVYGDFDDVLDVNPLGKVPALKLDGADVLVDSAVILHYLDDLAGPEASLVPLSGAERWRVLQRVTVAAGLSEKVVELNTETLRRPPGKTDEERAGRCRRQILSALAWLEQDFQGPWMCGGDMTQADVTAAVAWTHMANRQPDFTQEIAGQFPSLASLNAKAEALPAFQSVPSQEG
jgi:glutathione S-transferase